MENNKKLFKLALDLVNSSYELNAKKIFKNQAGDNTFLNSLSLFQKEIEKKKKKKVTKNEAYNIARNLILEKLEKGIKKIDS